MKYIDIITRKICTIDQLEEKVNNWRHPESWRDVDSTRRPVVGFTCGSYDLGPHFGHLNYLAQAADLASYLVVAINSNKSVKENKGDKRPIVDEIERATLVASLFFVDAVVVFDEKTTLPLLEKIKPDIYIKGDNYTLETLVQVEKNYVESYGGKIALVPGVPGVSTTNIINKILDTHKDIILK